MTGCHREGLRVEQVAEHTQDHNRQPPEGERFPGRQRGLAKGRWAETRASDQAGPCPRRLQEAVVAVSAPSISASPGEKRGGQVGDFPPINLAAIHLKRLAPYIGHLPLTHVDDGLLAPYIKDKAEHRPARRMKPGINKGQRTSSRRSHFRPVRPKVCDGISTLAGHGTDDQQAGRHVF